MTHNKTHMNAIAIVTSGRSVLAIDTPLAAAIVGMSSSLNKPTGYGVALHCEYEQQ
jgi:hypothetical protein